MTHMQRERYMLFARGWSAGASAREIAQQDADYLAGWADGADARKLALAYFARRVGYAPTVLRLADGRPLTDVSDLIGRNMGDGRNK